MSYLAELEQKHMAAIAQIEKLEARVKELEAAVEQLSGVPAVPRQLKLARHEAKFLEVLLSRATVTKEVALAQVYADRWNQDEIPEIKIVDVFVCKLRKKLKPFGLKIDTQWG